MSDPRIVVHGKWILAGEHAVLRGSPALVFPVFGKSLELGFRAEATLSGPTASFSGIHGGEMELLFWGVIERALGMTGHTRQDLAGHFDLSNTIPVGAGLGASAALCVAVGRHFSRRGWVNEASLSEFCRELENLFHGESSGVDIAVALSNQGLSFERHGEKTLFTPRWSPQWYISYSGRRGVTSECVAKVKRLWDRDATLAQRIDREMQAAVGLATQALKEESSTHGFQPLAEAITMARRCFEQWELTGGEIGEHLQRLMDAGAAAVKPTGSGNGGFVLSLWANSPPERLREMLISVSR